MIDLDSLRGIVSRATGTGWQAAYRQDVEALIAEVERLRNERDHFRTAMEYADAEVERLREQRHDDGKGRRVDAYLAGALDERAAVVAWLRHCDKLCRDLDGRETPVRGLYRLSADRIERGEHRREEEKP